MKKYLIFILLFLTSCIPNPIITGESNAPQETLSIPTDSLNEEQKQIVDEFLQGQ